MANTSPGRSGSCPVCRHPASRAIDRHLVTEPGTAGRKGARGLARLSGLGRKQLVAHQQECLAPGSERRERALSRLWRLAEDLAPEAVRAYREREGSGGA